MENAVREPKTLQEAIIYFADPDNCLSYMIAHRWKGVVACPICGRTDATFLKNQRKWQCRSHHATRQFSAKTGTIFEDSPLGLDKWLTAMWMLTNCKNGNSSWELHRTLGVTQKTAWFMLHRVRKAMQNNSFVKLTGDVEVDESFIGGKARNMHKNVKARRITGSGPTDKTAVMGILERGDAGKPKDREKHSKVITMVVPNRKKKTLQAEVKANVQAGAALYSDALLSYDGLESDYAHQVVDHAVEYVRGKVHTNGLENFWSLTDRTIGGTYVSVEPFHLFRYLDEQSFRFNNRGTRKMPVNDSDRFKMVLAQVAGKRLTYAELTGKLEKEKQAEPF
jgi:transposase-like protein